MTRIAADFFAERSYPPPREAERLALRNLAVDEASEFYVNLMPWHRSRRGGLGGRPGRRVVHLVTGRVYRSAREAARGTGRCDEVVRTCCNLERGDFRWSEDV